MGRSDLAEVVKEVRESLNNTRKTSKELFPVADHIPDPNWYPKLISPHPKVREGMKIDL